MSIQDLVNDHPEQVTPQLTMGVGIQLLSALKQVHQAGYTHNDIKLSNIMIASHQDDAILIDYGYAQKYSEEGTHLEQKEIDSF